MTTGHAYAGLGGSFLYEASQMKVKLTVTKSEQVEHDVTFPVYRKHDVSNDNDSIVYYTRWDSEGMLWSICKTVHYGGGSLEYQIERQRNYYPHPNDSANYTLGRGEYALTADEFGQILSETEQFLKSARSPL